MNRRTLAAALVLAAGIGLAPRAFAADAFLKLDGIDGESQDANYPGSLEIDSSRLGSLPESAERVSATGAGAGRVTFNPFSITRKVDKASPALFQACSKGKHFPTATITMRKAGGTQQEYLVVTLHDVSLSSYRKAGFGDAQTETFLVSAAGATLEPPRPQATAIRSAPLASGALTAVQAPRITGVSASAPFLGTGVTVAISSTGPCVNAFVAYGDGSINEGHALTGTSTQIPAHVYSTPGLKTIQVGGYDAPYWSGPQKHEQHHPNDCTGWAETTVTLRSEAAPAPAMKR